MIEAIETYVLMTTMQTFYYVHLNQISVKLFELFNYIAMHCMDAFIVNIKCNFFASFLYW
jgi:hypothetical protein